MSSKMYLFLTVCMFGFVNNGFSAGLASSNKSQLSPTKKVLNQQSYQQVSKPMNVSSVAKVVVKPKILVKGYKEWKNEKVQAAIKKVAITRAQIDYKKMNNQIFQKTEAGLGKDIEIDKLEGKLRNDLFSLEVAQQLNVQDYFAIYLTKLDNRSEAFKEAAQKMHPDEVAELINIFADSFLAAHVNDGVSLPSASAASFGDPIK
ncbi:MAG: hypothetical protein KDD45_06895 [Bdellovibrionales bacterium]|nr:hypothetical protein [Bdellovibrionales bacterium]